MALESDGKGFLIGDPIDFKASTNLLVDIRDELRSLRSSMVYGGVKIRDPKAVAAASARASAQPRENGRFVSKDKTAETNKRTSQGFLSNAAGNVKDATKIVGGSAIEFAKRTDPVIDALSNIGGPMLTGFRTLFKSRYKPANDNLPWFKRIFRELRLTRKENSQYSKAETKALKKIEDKPSVSGGGGGRGWIAGLLTGALPILAIGFYNSIVDYTSRNIIEPIFNTANSIAEKIGGAWESMTAKVEETFGGIKTELLKTWDTAVKTFTDLWKPIGDFLNDKLGIVTKTVSETATKANEVVKEKTGVDVKGGYQKTVDFTSRNVIEPVANAAKSVIDTVTMPRRADMRLPGAKGVPPEIVEAAMQSEIKYGVPAKVTIAQWQLESGGGKHMPTGSNNPFGIKARKGQEGVTAGTTEVFGGKTVHIPQKFAKYGSIQEAFDEHAKLIATKKAYARAMKHKDNPEAFADALTGVYATDPNYGKKLKAIMARQSMATTPVVSSKPAVDDGKPAISPAVAKPTLAVVSSPSIAVAKPPSVAKPSTVTESPAVATPITSPRIKENQSDQGLVLVGPDVGSRLIAHIVTGSYSKL